MLTITGLMRSGTSATARIAQQIGVSMGAAQTMPQFGLDPEFEDYELASQLTHHAIWGDPWDPERVFREYIEKRQKDLEGKLAWEAAIGFKSPLLLLWWGAWEAAHSKLGEPLRLIVTERGLGACRESIDRVPQVPSEVHSVIHRIQDELEKVRPFVKPDRVFSYDRVRSCPKSVAMELALEAGIDSVDLDRAVRGVRTTGEE